MDRDATLAWNQIKSLVTDFGFHVTIGLVRINGEELWCIDVDSQKFCHLKINSAVKAAGDWARGRPM